MDKSVSKYKHNKFKDTPLLFELCVKKMMEELTEGTSPARNIIRKHFKDGSPLKKHVDLYLTLQTLSESKKKRPVSFCADVINALVESRRKMDNSLIERARYDLIRDVKRNYDLDEFFNQHIANYKNIAQINEFFEGWSDTVYVSPIRLASLKESIISKVSSQPASLNDANLTQFLTNDPNVRNKAIQFLVEDFNQKYKSVISEDDGELIRALVNNTQTQLKRVYSKYVNENVRILEKKLKLIPDNVLKVKFSSILEFLQSQKHINDTHVSSALGLRAMLNEI